MLWMTRNPASARHAASADQLNALLQSLLPTKFSISVATVYIPRIHWQQSCPGKAATGGYPSASSSGARCWCQPAVQAPPQPAIADGIHRNAQGSSKYATKPKGEDRSSRRPWSLKTEISLKLELKPKVQDQSKRGSPKRESKPEVIIEAGSARRSRISTIMLILIVKTITQVQEKNSHEKPSLQNWIFSLNFHFELVSTFNQQEF